MRRCAFVLLALLVMPGMLGAYEVFAVGVDRLGEIPYGPVAQAFGAPMQTWWGMRFGYGLVPTLERVSWQLSATMHAAGNEGFGEYPSFGLAATAGLGCSLPIVRPSPDARRLGVHLYAGTSAAAYLLLPLFLPSFQCTAGFEAALRISCRISARRAIALVAAVRYHAAVFDLRDLGWFERSVLAPGVHVEFAKLGQ